MAVRRNSPDAGIDKLAGSDRRLVWWGALVIVAAGLVAYHRSFSVPFFFDDIPAIVRNESIRDWTQLGHVFHPPPRGGVDSRPLVNLSLAFNYRVGGLDPLGYHIYNLVIHLLAGLTLFGLLRRILLQPSIPERLRTAATAIAFCVALLWTVHPLLSETVICSVQRNESMVSLFYLLTLYCFLRAAEPGGRQGWYGAAVTACLAGMASKEVMVTAPLVVFLLDGLLLAGSFREAWRRRWRWHLAVAMTWLLLGWLILQSGGTRGGIAGSGQGTSSWTYLLTQAHAITVYLKLSVWPNPLIIDYGVWLASGIGEVWRELLLVTMLAVLTGVALWKWPRAGFAGACFFLILAPSSSVYPLVSQTMSEHRMYLPLAAVLASLVLAGCWLNRRVTLALCLVLAGGATLLTIRRSSDYASETVLWSDLLAKDPANAWAHFHLAETWSESGRLTDAETEFRRAAQMLPHHAPMHLSLGLVVARQQRPAEALTHFQEAVRLKPDYPQAHFNCGRALLALGRPQEAGPFFAEAVRLFPAYLDAEIMWGLALMQSGKADAAVGHFERALQIWPQATPAVYNLGLALAALGRIEEALPRFGEAARLKPDDASIQFDLGMALLQVGRTEEARARFAETVRLDPAMQSARKILQQLPAAP